jgi:hypothetical protein
MVWLCLCVTPQELVRYSTMDVLEPAWRVMEARMRKASDLDEVRHAAAAGIIGWHVDTNTGELVRWSGNRLTSPRMAVTVSLSRNTKLPTSHCAAASFLSSLITQVIRCHQAFLARAADGLLLTRPRLLRPLLGLQQGAFAFCERINAAWDALAQEQVGHPFYSCDARAAVLPAWSTMDIPYLGMSS